MGGIPIFALAAFRAQALGMELVVATSDQRDDDVIERACQKFGLKLYRGPLDDVLGRFIGATHELDDADFCIRLTADNVFPDACFLEALVAIRSATDATYLAYGSGADGLPYGLSAEVFTVGALRDANLFASTAHDREHVTSWIATKHRVRSKPDFPGSQIAFGKLRCTIDTPDDYKRLLRVFDFCPRPIDASWLELTEILQFVSGQSD